MKNKKRILQFLVVSIVFTSVAFGVIGFADTVFAQQSLGNTAAQNAAAVAGVKGGDGVLEDDGVFTKGAKYLLYALLWVLTGLVQVGASVFAWATKPEYISGPTGLLNLDSVYILWKFIRDFFNLFFIFLLLFAAMGTVFQVDQFNLRKNFPKIILAAIAINFSFPLTRIIIDLGNVPMYFFADFLVQAGGGNGNALYSVPSAFFSSAQMGDILLLPDPSVNGTLIPLLTAVIFSFIFMITLFTLAILFVIRLLTLVVLLIFSPIGVAASIIPGLSGLGKKWWSKLMTNVFFGPAAMLMIVVALRFTLELNGGSLDAGGTSFIQGVSETAPASNPSSQSKIISQGVFFIPIILMWMAMHLGKEMGAMGASQVIAKADKAADWGKKQILFGKGSATRWGVKKVASPATNRLKGVGSGLKDRFDNTVIGGKYWKERGEDAEARAKARAKGIFTKGGVKKELSKAELQLQDKRAREQEKKWKDDGKSISEISEKLTSSKSTDVEKLAAANFLSNEKEGIKNATALTAALEMANKTGNKDLYDKALNAATDDALDMTPEQVESIRQGYKDAQMKEFKAPEKNTGESDIDYQNRVSDARNKELENLEKNIQGKLTNKFKKEGKVKVLIDYEIAMEARRGPVNVPAVYDKYMSKMKVKEIAKMQDVYDETSGDLDPEVARYLTSQNWTNKMKQDAYSELEGPEQAAWERAGMKPS